MSNICNEFRVYPNLPDNVGYARDGNLIPE